ncbi:MAG TPA: hypothetical protein DIT49_04805 [Clostridiales bacterium]|nr:hypothetical protein [Clostridiales bacterium]
MTVLVSACLMGVACKYSGGDNRCEELLQAARAGGHTLIPVCPEVYGGLPTPRTPAERQGERVVSRTGEDVTAQYQKGAEIALALARQTGCTGAILKANSPSCGVGAIYDGTFSHRLTPGDGVTAQLLRIHGLRVVTERDYKALLGE